MTPRNIYTILLTRRHNLYRKLMEDSGVTKNEVSLNTDSFNSSGKVSFSGVIHLNIDVTDLWLKIHPESVTYNFQGGRERNIYVLRRNAWTSILYEKLYAESKTPFTNFFPQCGNFIKWHLCNCGW